MPLPVSLRDIATDLEILPEGVSAYLDRETGEVLIMTDDLEAIGEEDESEIPDWAREDHPKVRAILAGDERWIELPDKFEIHEWNLMRAFAEAQPAPWREELMDAIHGTGAFRHFRDCIALHKAEAAWYAFRTAAIEAIVSEVLEEHRIPYGP